MRINKYLAMCNVGSRRSCEEFITGGKVSVNGKRVTDLATQINDGDTVTAFGKVCKPDTEFVYVLMNKPKGIVTTCHDEHGRTTVIDLLDTELKSKHIFPIGRLDYDSEGLLILTNDGDFAKDVTHPSKKIEKVYIANIDKKITNEHLEALATGIDIDGEVTLPARVTMLNPLSVQIGITQGRNRQVRKMFLALGYKITSLRRVSIGAVRVGTIPLGKYQVLTARPKL